MPKINCQCGNIIQLGKIPNPNEWLIISDVEYDNYSGSIDAEELYNNMRSMIVCNNCGRIMIFWNGWEKTPKTYLIEQNSA